MYLLSDCLSPKYHFIAYLGLGQGASPAQIGHGQVDPYGHGVSLLALFFFPATRRAHNEHEAPKNQRLDLLSDTPNRSFWPTGQLGIYRIP